MQKNKEGLDEKIIDLGGHKAKLTLGNPAVQQKRIDKLNAMRIAMTYIEGQGMMKVSPEEATKIADKFLKWLKK